MSREQILTLLTQPRDRRVMITLVLASGRMLTGGVRDVIRRVLDNPRLSRSRLERTLSASAIRARLRKLPGWPGALRVDDVRWAFDFDPWAKPPNQPTAE